ncbi:putative TBC domain protein [Morchella conica CCBAS932]|uniref:Putative TBC domain protein n=1 Tax=Morchella conica CCBAS932 TaxID=1392247 RepID=A0A3N4KMS4_9PEZI|nr:putative TBC domain protein [Morchella conica CCBAS932]
MNDEKIPALDHGSDFAEAESPGIEYVSRPVSGAERDLGKASAAEEACLVGDREAIARLAISKDGLLNDKIRRKAWPILLGYDDADAVTQSQHGDKDGHLEDQSNSSSWKDLPPHGDENQVQLDVNRSFIYYPTNMSPRESKARKQELSDLIVEVLRRHPMLCYFQGFHDICQVFLLVLGPRRAVPAVEHISLLRIRDFMLPSMSPALDHLHLLYPLLYAADKKLCAHISRTQPFFALAATLTLYAHDIQEYSDIARLFDVLLAMDPVFPVYLFAEIVLHRKEELFEIPDDEPEMLHSILSKLPKPLDLEGLISRANLLLDTYPPESLSTWSKISPKSVLKTSRISPTSSGKSYTLEQAEGLFHAQCRELEWAKKKEEIFKRLAKHKGPTTAFALTIVVGLSAVGLGWYMRKSGVNLDLDAISTILTGSATLRRFFATIGLSR